jgi:phenylalanyl-tRNA synthetase beta chain
MKVSLNWLKEYVKIDLSVDELVAKIGTQLGAVEEVIDLRHKYKGIHVVQIVEAKPHPDADKLSIYQATDGKQQMQVVSGDRTLNVGDKVAWLAPGTTVPSTINSDAPVVLDVRDMCGHKSHGMFASGKELDINDDHDSVLKLDTDAKAGELLAKAYGLNDVIIDIENKMFTHRPDCFGLLGVAREIAGIQGQAFRSPDWYLQKNGTFLKPQSEPIKLSTTNKAPTLCPQYNAVVMQGIVVAPSPIAIQSYLKRVGIRPINNIVDVTNYLMYVTGQPMHAFDYHKVAAVDDKKDASIVVREAQEGDELTLLDGRTVKPSKGTLLICSRSKPLAIGGVMGGRDTEVDDNTTTIILESATFNMYAIRRTSMELGIFSDAVTRFSKGQSEAQGKVVLAEAVRLINEHIGGTIASELGVERPKTPTPVTTGIKFVNQRLGLSLPPGKMRGLLENVEMRVAIQGGQLKINPPFWRRDIEIAEDIIEEIGRLYGYDKLPHELPLRTTQAVDMPGIELLLPKIRTLLAAAGNNELQTYSFVSSKLLQKTGQDAKPAYRLRNALSPELELIRTSLLPSLLDKVHANHKAGYSQFGLFELGKSHNKFEIGKDDLPQERRGLAYVFSADQKAAGAWQGAPFYQAKRQLLYLLEALHYKDVNFQLLVDVTLGTWWLNNIADIFERKRSALVLIGDKPLGVVGEFTASVQEQFKLPAFSCGFELDIGELHGIQAMTTTYEPLLRFPATEQDVCFKVANNVSYAQLEQLIHKSFLQDERLHVTIDPVDIYQRDTDAKHKQITYRLTLRHHDRTLTTEEVNKLIEKLVEQAAKTFEAERV